MSGQTLIQFHKYYWPIGIHPAIKPPDSEFKPEIRMRPNVCGVEIIPHLPTVVRRHLLSTWQGSWSDPSYRSSTAIPIFPSRTRVAGRHQTCISKTDWPLFRQHTQQPQLKTVC